ncbi:MAG: hypothetical protein IKL10_02955 [Clostridia bacterium]|nr:hypothetical protein [Clostridia bacterium]
MKNIKKMLSIIVAALMLLSTFAFVASAEECVEHKYSITSIPPTCMEDGYLLYLCSVCGHNYKDYVGGSSALGHSFGEWEVVDEASCTAEGLMKQVCSRCKGSATKTIPVLEHIDFDSSGECDDCGTPVEVKTVLSPFDWLVALFNAIIQWFRDIFA